MIHEVFLFFFLERNLEEIAVKWQKMARFNAIFEYFECSRVIAGDLTWFFAWSSFFLSRRRGRSNGIWRDFGRWLQKIDELARCRHSWLSIWYHQLGCIQSVWSICRSSREIKKSRPVGYEDIDHVAIQLAHFVLQPTFGYHHHWLCPLRSSSNRPPHSVHNGWTCCERQSNIYFCNK